MRVILCGANHGVSLSDPRDPAVVTAYASLWQVDWSERGAGHAVVLWHEGRVRVLTEELALGSWLESSFTRHFPETVRLPWPTPIIERTAVEFRVNLAIGMAVSAGDVQIALSGPLDRRAVLNDEFVLDGVPYGLRLVILPMEYAEITVEGVRLPGTVTLDGTPQRPRSSAFLTTGAVWLR